MEPLGYIIQSSPSLGGFFSYIEQVSSKKSNDPICSCDGQSAEDTQEICILVIMCWNTHQWPHMHR